MMSAPAGARRPGQGGVRLLRAAALGGSSLLLAAWAHLAGGGAAPNTAAMVLAGCATGVIAVSVTARRCRMPLLLTVLGLEQAGLHLLFGSSAAALCLPNAPMSHGLHAGASCVSVAGQHSMAEPGLVMVLAHVAALIVMAWVLARGEQWVWGLVDAATAVLAPRPSRRRGRLARQVPAPAYRRAGIQLVALAPTRGPPQG
ncbi:hypothetical protein GCM10022204_22920 [Microlunatus aurantiacus]|uniref:MFS transporter n=1 Tax=Microlunatus aurantiacus TaxID=446786 RepID=A0ABP7DIK7_9ACTN